MEKMESRPSREAFIGTPMTGRGVMAAMTPGRGAAIPAGKLMEAEAGIFNIKGRIIKRESGYFLTDGEGKVDVPVEINSEMGDCEALLERFSWDKKALAQLKVGDSLELTWTEALLISVEGAKK